MPLTQIQATHLESRGLIRVGGAESRPFLQGLVTNDVDLVSPVRPIYAGLLTPQGKFLHDFIIVQIGESLVLDTERARVPELLRRLTMYRLRAKVDLADVTESYAVYAVFGPGAERVADEKLGTTIADPRTPLLGLRLYCTESPVVRLESLGVTMTAYDTYDAHRIGLGVPNGGQDIPVEKAFPLEYGFDPLGAVSYDKGCYVGQELTARTHNRGKVKKALYRIAFSEGLPTPGTDIHQGETVVGEILSASGRYALAHLRIDAATAGERLCAGTLDIARCTPAPVIPAQPS
jgi:folate-binding protein YgfZ